MIKVRGFASLYKLPLFVRMRTKTRNNTTGGETARRDSLFRRFRLKPSPTVSIFFQVQTRYLCDTNKRQRKVFRKIAPFCVHELVLLGLLRKC